MSCRSAASIVRFPISDAATLIASFWPAPPSGERAARDPGPVIKTRALRCRTAPGRLALSVVRPRAPIRAA
jgi:hypothetical protein